MKSETSRAASLLRKFLTELPLSPIEAELLLSVGSAQAFNIHSVLT